MLIAMTLAGLSLMRSMDTASMIAGNMAFQQAATHSGDSGTEAAVAWLEANNTGNTLWTSNLPQGYAALRQDPATGQSWETFWSSVLVPAGQVITLASNASGNTVSYAIQRLCSNTGDPSVSGTGCAVSQAASSNSSNSKGAGAITLQYNSAVYYRVTSRVVGPRNTVSFIQAIIAL
jgi:hypothetical protein